MSLSALLAFCLARSGNRFLPSRLRALFVIRGKFGLGGRWKKKKKKRKRMNCCVLGGAVSALIGNVLLTGAAEQVYSSCDIAVTFIQSAPAAASPQEAQCGPTWAAGGPQRGEWALFELADTPLSGNFCCLCRKASGGGSGGAAVILGAGWAFSTSPPFQETHFAVSSLCVCKRREGVEAKGHGALGLNDRAPLWEATLIPWVFTLLEPHVYMIRIW